MVVLTIERNCPEYHAEPRVYWDFEMASKIRTAEFKNRLAVLCLRGGGRGFPRKHRDQHILFKSITLMLEIKRNYAEDELNECLAKWLGQVGRTVEIDHVSLRRYLVDAGYLTQGGPSAKYPIVIEPRVDNGTFCVNIEYT